MGNALTQALKGNTRPAAGTGLVGMVTKTNVVEPVRDAVPERPVITSQEANGTAAGLAAFIERIEVEAVVGGCLMTLTLGGGLDPEAVAAELKAMGAKVRDDFPARGAWGGGKRDAVLSRCQVIQVRATANGTFIDLICQNGDDLTVSVTKSKVETFLADLTAVGKVHAANLAKIQSAMDGKGQATVILREDEQFGVFYWSKDGKNYMDSMQAEPPARAA